MLYRIMVWIPILYLISLPTLGRVLEYKVVNEKSESFDFKHVCKKLGFKNSILIDVAGEADLDCMGRVAQVKYFCQKFYKNRSSYLRASIDKVNRQVVCHSGRSVHLSVACDGAYEKYCMASDTGCGSLKMMFARNLELFHHSIFMDDSRDVRRINCYFSYRLDGELYGTPKKL